MDALILLKITVAAIASGALFAALGVVAPPRPPEAFTIQLSDWPGDQLFALIEPLGLAPEAQHVHLEIRRSVTAADDPIKAFRSGLADAVLIGLERLPELLSDEIRLIYVYDEVVGGGALVAAPGVMRAGDIGSRPVGITFGGAGNPLVATLLSRAGLDAGSAPLVTLAPEAAEAALRAGQVAAVAVLSPERARSLSAALNSPVLASTEDFAGLSSHVLVVKEGRIPDRREALVMVLRALSQTAHSCRAGRDHCMELLASATGRPAVEWRRDFEALHLLEAADNATLLGGGNEAPLARRLSALPGAASAPVPRPAMEWLDPSLAAEAARP